MKAIVLTANRALEMRSVPEPTPGPTDLLVRVEAVAVNPLDAKLRAAHLPGDGERILGFDAAGVVEHVGSEVSRFRCGDAVFYAGCIDRPGCYAEWHRVDERLAGRKPGTLDFVEGAALPLTALTAWEALFERLGLTPSAEAEAAANRPVILVLGGAGGVGSMAIQLARRVTGATVITTASRPASRAWCLALGADACLDHHRPLAEQLVALGLDGVDFILNCANLEAAWEEMAHIIRPMGKICLLVSASGPLDLNPFKNKSVTLVWEFLFTRPLFGKDPQRHGAILEQLAGRVDSGALRSTLRHNVGPLTVDNLEKALLQLASGHTIGKLVLTRIPQDHP